MSSITLTHTTKNTTENESKNLNNDIIFKKTTSKITKFTKTLTIKLNSQEIVMSNNTNLEKEKESEKESESKLIEEIKLRSILKNNKFKSTETITKIVLKPKIVKFIDELSDEEYEVNLKKDILTLSENLPKKSSIKIIDNLNEEKTKTEKKRTSSNKQLAEIFYIPSLKNIIREKENEKTKKMEKNEIIKNNKNLKKKNAEDKVNSKCCTIF